MAISKSITAKGIDIRTMLNISDSDYISLTDIAKYASSDPNDTIRNWMRGRDVIEFLGLWEQLNNPDFNPVEFDGFRKEAGKNAFTMSPKRWIESTNAIGIISKAGRYGGTYAHTDIAFEFASWVSPEFKLYIIKDYQRLKANESKRLGSGWDAKRELTKINYRIHTDAIKEYIIPKLPENYSVRTYADEADILNIALFGTTAKDWRANNPDSKGNIRDQATTLQLVILINLESMNAELIKKGLPQATRLEILHNMAESQMQSLSQGKNLKQLESTLK